MGTLIRLFFVFIGSTSLVFGGVDGAFPLRPDLEKTPGSLCDHPSEYRYPDRIPYCKRDVESATKREIIQDYDQSLDYKVGSMNRQEFKIDHHIPLCLGGSNDVDNLWPQHRTVYEQTDPLEPALCDLLGKGMIGQTKAVEVIREAKQNPYQAARIYEQRLGQKLGANKDKRHFRPSL
jgi:hypothetical protein